MKNILRTVKIRINRLGPGFITGAADDDPSGIATYAIIGAKFGYQLTWLTLFTTPMMIAIQQMSGRIGLLSGTGLAGIIRKQYAKPFLFSCVLLVMGANVINIGADLGMMAASLRMITGISFSFWLAACVTFIVALEVLLPYRVYSQYLKWTACALLVYLIDALLVKQNGYEILRYTLIPSLSLTKEYAMSIVAFFGTTISPYLFFWQAAEEVETQIQKKKIPDFNHHPRASQQEIHQMSTDTKLGMVFSNIIAFSIILTTAATLNQNGIWNIQTPQQAALALQPLAGNYAYILFTFGIIGIGLQAIPILAGSAAYAFSEAFGFQEGLGKKFLEAKVFYIVIGLSTIIGAGLNGLGINTITALYYASIINGFVAVPLIFVLISLANNEQIVGKYKNSPITNLLAWTTFWFMAGGTLLLLYFLLFPNR